MATTWMYPRAMSMVQTSSHLSRSQKRLYRAIAIRALKDRTGSRTYLALKDEFPKPEFRTPTESVNLVSKALRSAR